MFKGDVMLTLPTIKRTAPIPRSFPSLYLAPKETAVLQQLAELACEAARMKLRNLAEVKVQKTQLSACLQTSVDEIATAYVSFLAQRVKRRLGKEITNAPNSESDFQTISQSLQHDLLVYADKDVRLIVWFVCG